MKKRILPGITAVFLLLALVSCSKTGNSGSAATVNDGAAAVNGAAGQSLPGYQPGWQIIGHKIAVLRLFQTAFTLW